MNDFPGKNFVSWSLLFRFNTLDLGFFFYVPFLRSSAGSPSFTPMARADPGSEQWLLVLARSWATLLSFFAPPVTHQPCAD